MASGGVTARNTRQGFRSEYIVKYIFSAFGTATDVSTENDLGIDLLCNLTTFDGLIITHKFTYGIQVKSAGAQFVYHGKQASTWLSKLEFPLLLVEVDKADSRIKVFSTWNLNRYLLDFHTEDEQAYPENLIFTTALDGELNPPDCASGNIPVGKPILDFVYSDIDDKDKCDNFYKVLSEWLEFDHKNYLLRRTGVPCAYGYTNWDTNRSPKEFHVWHKPYFYSPFHTEKIKILLAEAFVPLGLYNRASSNGGQILGFKEEFNDLKAIVDKYLLDKMDDFGKNTFKDEI